MLVLLIQQILLENQLDIKVFAKSSAVFNNKYFAEQLDILIFVNMTIAIIIV
ncbi:Putative uncharacterized protein [Moritella viscosa]|nr:Putative uncharacterized protein [Moritella viscosa]